MPELLGPFGEPVSCRLCGATRARPHENEWGICFTCYHNFDWRRERGAAREVQFLKYAASYLVREMKRFKRFGFSGRCECVAVVSSAPNGGGYQCGCAAAYITDGRKVCGIHNKKPQPFVGGAAGPVSEYDRFSGFIAEFGSADHLFRRAVLTAVEAWNERSTNGESCSGGCSAVKEGLQADG